MATVELVNPSGKSLLFVIPAWQRVEMAYVCYRQMEDLLEALLDRYEIQAEALVISGDENIAAAVDEGLAFLNYENDTHLGGKLNAGYTYAHENGYDYVCAVGNDSWLHPDRFAWLPADDAIICTRNYTCVGPDGSEQAWFKFRDQGGTGSRIIPIGLLARCGYKPLPPQQRSGCDTGTLLTICRDVPRAPHLVYTDLHPYEVVGFQSGVQITPWSQLVRHNLVEWQEPWSGLADHYDPYLVQQMREVYQEAAVA